MHKDLLTPEQIIKVLEKYQDVINTEDYDSIVKSLEDRYLVDPLEIKNPCIEIPKTTTTDNPYIIDINNTCTSTGNTYITWHKLTNS